MPARLMGRNYRNRMIPTRCSGFAAVEPGRGNPGKCSRAACKSRNSLAWSVYLEWLGSLWSCWAIQSEMKIDNIDTIGIRRGSRKISMVVWSIGMHAKSTHQTPHPCLGITFSGLRRDKDLKKNQLLHHHTC